MSCCTEYGCRRATPIEVRRAPFSGQWVAITRYKRHDGGMIEAHEKHVLTPVSQAEIELRGSVLVDLHQSVLQWRNDAEPESTERASYERVLDRLAELAEAKETALIGPRPEAAADGAAS